MIARPCGLCARPVPNVAAHVRRDHRAELAHAPGRSLIARALDRLAELPGLAGAGLILAATYAVVALAAGATLALLEMIR